MARYSTHKITNFFNIGDTAQTTAEKGKALEDLISYVFQKVLGVEVAMRNKLNAFQTEEIDVSLWNNKHLKGLHFLPNILLVECKNWSKPLGSAEVAYFVQRLTNRGVDYGTLVASNGITGNAKDFTAARLEITLALKSGIRVIVLTREEIESLITTDCLVKLLKKKLCELAVTGTVI